MNRYLLSALVATFGLASATGVMAQDTSPTTPTTPQDQGSTRSPATSNDSTTTHQANAKSSHKQMMKDCEAKQRAENSSMSASAAKKACKEQMKSNSSSESKSY